MFTTIGVLLFQADDRRANSQGEDIVARAEEFHTEFQRLLNTEGVDAALEAWNTWINQPPSSGAGASNQLLSVFDPSADPRWMRLLTSRIYALAVAKMVHKAEQAKYSNVKEATHAYQKFRLRQEARVQETRALMDSLATSNWGAKVPGKILLEFAFVV